MSLEIVGKVVKILPEQTGSGKFGTWVRQDFIIETEDQYPKKVCIAAWGDKADAVKNLSNGEKVTVSFNVESREYNERWYTDLKAWKIEKGENVTGGQDAPPKFTEDDIPPPEEEDLPF